MAPPLSFLVAFGTGVVSFLAPCTLALVPLYISYLAGFTLAEAGEQSAARARVSTVANTLLFTMGFTAVFVALGASLGALSESVVTFSPWLNRVSGVFIIVLGLISLGLIEMPTFALRYNPQQRFGQKLRWAGSFLIGATFALGWTPCVGPILGAILLMASTGGSAGYGALLLTSYSLGLMLPFVAAGLATGWTSRLLRSHGRWLQYAHQAAGVLLIVFGITLFTGVLPLVSSYLALGT